MRVKNDKLAVSAYVRHGDTCALDTSKRMEASVHSAHDTLGCASGHKAGDYVLVAKFAYLQEGIDYCHVAASRGVRMLLVSRIVPSSPMEWQYWPEGVRGADKVTGPVRVVKQSKTEVTQ